MKDITFTEYLQDKHCEQFQGFKDAMVDDYERWLEDLSIDDWINLGDQFGCISSLRTIEKLEKAFEEIKK